MEQPFEVGDIVEVSHCPLAKIFDIEGKIGKVTGFISFSGIVTTVKIEIGDSTFFLHPMELKKIDSGTF